FKDGQGVVQMGYIKEIDAIHIKQETDPLTSAAAYLWFVQMAINSRTGWKEVFSVGAPLLCVRAALSEGTFKRARKELQEKGYIHVVSQGANRAAAYQMISLVNDVDAAQLTVEYNQTAPEIRVYTLNVNDCFLFPKVIKTGKRVYRK